MAVIPADILARYVDLMCAFYTRAVGTQASGYGFGTSGGAWGCAGSVQDLKGVLLNQDTNLDSVALLTPIMQTLEAGVFGAQVAKSYLAPMIGTLSNHVQLYGVASVTDLDSYMSFLNVSDTVKWQCLAPPTWRNLNTFFTPSAKNVYYEVQQGATFVNGLGKGVVTGAGACTYTDQANVGELVTYSSSTGSIDNTKYAGGFPYALVSGLTGTGIVTVTGHGYDAITQAVVTGTWTATVTGNGLWQLSNVTYPQAALLGVSGIAVAAGISAGTIYVEAWRPIWRSVAPDLAFRHQHRRRCQHHHPRDFGAAHR